MSMIDIVCDKIHFRHEPRWCSRLDPDGGDGIKLCVLCVVKMMESEDIAAVRKSYALSGVSGVLKSSPGTLRKLLQQDQRVLLRFITALLGMLHTREGPSTFEKVDEVLPQLLLELQSELHFCFVLDELHKQLGGLPSAKVLLSTFHFIGRLLEAIPAIANIIAAQYVSLLKYFCSVLLYPDEELKASVIFVWLKLFETAAQAVPASIRDRVCRLLLQTLAKATSTHLISNCIGLLWLLVQMPEAVSALMSSGSLMCEENQSSLSQSSEPQPPEHSPLPLILKKFLLSGDEILQVSTAKCIASVLVHSPQQYSASFIKADVSEFLFDRLESTQTEVLLWSVYICLKLLSEDPHFFSRGHSAYGIDALVRSLKRTLGLVNLEVSKRGFHLLNCILERQPPEIHLFPSYLGFVAVLETLKGGVSSPCLLVAAQAVKAVSVLFRLNHQTRPVQFKAIAELIEAITERFAELSLSSHAHHNSGRLKSNVRSQASRSHTFLLHALVCFQSVCRLAEECAKEPGLKENVFTASQKTLQNEESLELLCQCVLGFCDSVWIPAVIKTCQYGPSVQILEPFYSVLSSQFCLLPSRMSTFSMKLASSGFLRLALEHKGLLCAGNRFSSTFRNPAFNASCCGFLLKLSMHLFKQSYLSSDCDPHDAEEVRNILLHQLPALPCLCDWPALLCEAPGLQLCDYRGHRATQYCVLTLLHLAFHQGDRLLPDQTVFSCVVWLLSSVQEQGSCALPHFMLRSALYLLSVTQDNSPSLDETQLKCISKALSSCQTFSSLYIHHPSLLHFFYRYSQFGDKYCPLALELWLSRKAWHTDRKMENSQEKLHGEDCKPEITELMALIEKYPAVIITLLEIVCTREDSLAQRALRVLEVFLSSQTSYEAQPCINLGPALLKALQKLSMEDNRHEHRNSVQVQSLPLVLRLLLMAQASVPESHVSNCEIDGIHFKLFYYVSNITGKLRLNNTESLMLAIKYMYHHLSLPPAQSTGRAVSMLLSNTALMELLQAITSSSPSPASAAQLCSSHLLLSSLITLQRVHLAKVHKTISWSLEKAIQRLVFQKRNTDSLLLASYLALLQALLDVDLTSPVLSVSTGRSLVGPRPLGVEDGVLYPLGSKGAQFLAMTLNGLLIQKHETLLGASVNCLSSLLSFLQRKSPTTARRIACQPWCCFVLFCLSGSGQSSLLHPATLQLITLLLKHSSTAVQWEPGLVQVLELVEKTGVKELSQEAADALRLLLTQIQRSTTHPPPTDRDALQVRSLLESLSPQSDSAVQSSNV